MTGLLLMLLKEMTLQNNNIWRMLAINFETIICLDFSIETTIMYSQ